MPVINYLDLNYAPARGQDGSMGVKVAKIDFFSLNEATIVFFPKGYHIDKHRHSGDILQVILQGEIEFDSRGEIEVGRSGAFHKCAPFWYSGTVLQNSYVLMVQQKDTHVVFAPPGCKDDDEI
jgi:hypothetical protein